MRTKTMRCFPRVEVSLLEGPSLFGCHFQVFGLQSLGLDLSPRTSSPGAGLGYLRAPDPSVGPQCYCGYYYSCKQQSRRFGGSQPALRQGFGGSQCLQLGGPCLQGR